MTTGSLLIVAGCLVAPHLLPLGRVTPRLAAGVWLATLALRALIAMVVLTFVVAFGPATDVFAMLTQWCWHLVPPLMSGHIGLSGDAFGHVATLAPAVILSVSGVSTAWGVSRAASAVRSVVRERAVGRGPYETVILGGRDVVIAAAGLVRPRIIVSTGALTDLDDAELAASIEHERGHVAHQHRYAMLFGQLLRAVSCFLPAGRMALRELAFHLERDADEYALMRRHDRLALASAICKALPARLPASGLMALNGGPSVLRRVQVLAEEAQPRGRAATRAAAACIALTATLAVSLIVSLPVLAADGVIQLSTAAAQYCPR
jgi:Zn-dependent protease with chaperone function